METGYFNKETARELRIGNIVKYYYNDEWFELEYDDLRSIYSLDSEVYDRVPLTEEWLLKLGAEKIETGLIIDSFYISNDFYLWIGDDYKIEIEFVHQLQNLYFDLTGNYLTIHE